MVVEALDQVLDQVEVDQIQSFHQLHLLAVAVEVEVILVYQVLLILGLMVDQEEEVVLHSHHQDPHLVALVIRLLQVLHKVMLVVVDTIKVAYILLLVEVAVQLLLVLQVEMDLVQDLQEMVEQGQLLLLQQVLLEEEAEEMVVDVLLYEIRHQLVLVEGVMVQQEQIILVVEVELTEVQVAQVLLLLDINFNN